MKKHILCFGDSNTHGLCPDPADTESRSDRYTENERWPCRLQKALGDGYLIIEEGLSGRTTVFDDPETEGLRGLDSLYSCLMSHKPLDLMILMLGTNDCKERFAANAVVIGAGLERLILKAKTIPAWRDGRPNILIIAPPWIPPEFSDEDMGPEHCIRVSPLLAEQFAQKAELHGCAFWDAEGHIQLSPVDHLHFTARGHAQMAEQLAKLVPGLL